ncbi:MAG: hypothetical protein NVSMB29_07880 [Candidatus Dormibacteria bacterium]
MSVSGVVRSLVAVPVAMLSFALVGAVPAQAGVTTPTPGATPTPKPEFTPKPTPAPTPAPTAAPTPAPPPAAARVTPKITPPVVKKKITRKVVRKRAPLAARRAAVGTPNTGAGETGTAIVAGGLLMVLGSGTAVAPLVYRRRLRA